ncbi:MAG: hypothetical protein ACFNM8_08440 [Prevotella histicola]|uniref:hypothetical protein n=1 Tax=Prevotella histicola TaxID=470565 RepID=UPI003621F31B
MKEKQKKVYDAPKCRMAQVVGTNCLLEASMPGSHNPATPGVTIGDAKKSPEWDMESSEDSVYDFSVWDD